MVRGGQVAVLALVAGLATGCTEEAAPPTSGSTARSEPTSSSPSTPSAPVLGAWHELVTLDDEVILVNGHPEDEAAPDAVELWTWSGAGWARANERERTLGPQLRRGHGGH